MCDYLGWSGAGIITAGGCAVREDIEKTEAKLSQKKQIVRDMLDVCYEAVWECDDRIDKMKL